MIFNLTYHQIAFCLSGLCRDGHERYTLVVGSKMAIRDMGIIKICVEHVTDGGSMVVAMDHDEDECGPDGVDDVIDEASGFAALHAMYICRDAERAGCGLIEREPIEFRCGEDHL